MCCLNSTPTTTNSMHNNNNESISSATICTMTSTRTNRTAIAATLLGLLATIAGTRAQAVPECVCSPRIYSVSFDLAQDCANTNDIEGLVSGVSAPTTFQRCNSDLIEVTQVQIIEEGYNTNINTTEIPFEPPVTSGTIEYISKSTELVPGVDLEDQAEDVIPKQVYVVLWGNDQSGEAISIRSRPEFNIIYTNECGSNPSPIEFDDSGLGNVIFVSTTILIYFVSTTHYIHWNSSRCSSLLSHPHHTHNIFDQI